VAESDENDRQHTTCSCLICSDYLTLSTWNGGELDWLSRPQSVLAGVSLRSGAYRVFTRKRAFLVKSSVTILRTGLHVAVNGDFAHNNLRSGTAFRPDCYLYTIRSASPR